LFGENAHRSEEGLSQIKKDTSFSLHNQEQVILTLVLSLRNLNLVNPWVQIVETCTTIMLTNEKGFLFGKPIA
jgi:hypothetical protein